MDIVCACLHRKKMSREKAPRRMGRHPFRSKSGSLKCTKLRGADGLLLFAFGGVGSRDEGGGGGDSESVESVVASVLIVLPSGSRGFHSPSSVGADGAEDEMVSSRAECGDGGGGGRSCVDIQLGSRLGGSRLGILIARGARGNSDVGVLSHKKARESIGEPK